jgi:sorbitol/mannitol transport system permease protein
MDGASLKKRNHLCADADGLPGIASTILLNIILAWNEAFWTMS